eukprot:TRINITY_DN914_c0_g1_i14.p1 TRINITY_DN914_c0_g1~~TRINITY_DN914_c0_g1_i14.p1  ORF type:complete len:288 (+),score=76.26 TRINITY_DN914_c0_g1_i14:620-1483(+)
MAQDRQNEIISSNSVDIYGKLRKIRRYLLWSLFFNVGIFLFFVWLFWTLEPLLFFLLGYKYVESFVSTLIALSELGSALQCLSAKPDSAFKESSVKIVLEALKLLLEGSYVLAIAFGKGVSVSNFCTTIYLGIRAASFTSKAWKAYKKIYQERKINSKILSIMREYEIKEEENCGICMMRMKTAMKLCCGHYYHANCVAKLLENSKKTCPVCKESFDKCYESQPESGFDLIVRKVTELLGMRRSRATEADVNRLQRLFPNIPRADLENEIVEAGSVERAILNISEWV